MEVMKGRREVRQVLTRAVGEGVKRTGRGLGFLNEVRNFSRSGQ